MLIGVLFGCVVCKSGLQAVRGKGVKFTMLAKTLVNGADSHPLYKWLKGEYIESLCDDRDLQCGGWAEAGECDKNPNYMLKNCKKSCTECSEAYPFGGAIKWNFDHFLVSRTGKVIARWDGAVDLLAAQQIGAIEHALKQKTPAGKKARDRAFVGSQKLRHGYPLNPPWQASAVTRSP